MSSKNRNDLSPPKNGYKYQVVVASRPGDREIIRNILKGAKNINIIAYRYTKHACQNKLPENCDFVLMIRSAFSVFMQSFIRQQASKQNIKTISVAKVEKKRIRTALFHYPSLDIKRLHSATKPIVPTSIQLEVKSKATRIVETAKYVEQAGKIITTQDFAKYHGIKQSSARVLLHRAYVAGLIKRIPFEPNALNSTPRQYAPLGHPSTVVPPQNVPPQKIAFSISRTDDVVNFVSNKGVTSSRDYATYAGISLNAAIDALHRACKKNLIKQLHNTIDNQLRFAPINYGDLVQDKPVPTAVPPTAKPVAVPATAKPVVSTAKPVMSTAKQLSIIENIAKDYLKTIDEAIDAVYQDNTMDNSIILKALQRYKTAIQNEM